MLPLSMKDLRTPTLVVLAALVAAAGFGLWHQGRELAARAAQLRDAGQQLAQKAAERQVLETRWKEAQAKVQQLEAAGTVPRRGPASPANARTVTSESIRQWLADADDPAVLRRLNTQARNQTMRRYAELLKTLNLPAGENEAFIKLLTDKRQAAMDTAVAEYHQGDDPAANLPAFQQAIWATRGDDENQISQLLGPAPYAQYQSFDRTTGQNNVVTNLQLSLSSTREPLAPSQAADLAELMESEGTGRVTSQVVADAAQILSPAQQQALQDLRAVQLSQSRQRNQPGQALPTGEAVIP
ncbi:MAG TPA: hypothetical protein VHV47_06795 [Opitutaceae bacterium]|jgi:hypothetical protein|nr:hypothetical protein [Opitutaceae bacterium]